MQGGGRNNIILFTELKRVLYLLKLSTALQTSSGIKQCVLRCPLYWDGASNPLGLGKGYVLEVKEAQPFQMSKFYSKKFVMIRQEWKINLFEDGMLISLCIYFDVSARYCHLKRVCQKHFFCIYMHYLACAKILKYNLMSHYLLSYLFVMKSLEKMHLFYFEQSIMIVFICDIHKIIVFISL